MNHPVFVFRASKGNQPGNPTGSPTNDHTQALNKAEKMEVKDDDIIDYEKEQPQVLPFLSDELWKRGILRQGWGLDTLDLREGGDTIEEKEKHWINNYIIAARKHWDYPITSAQAKGRWNILSRMLDMKEDMILLIPKTSPDDHQNDFGHFTVCQVENPYTFSMPSFVLPSGKPLMDFGHCINVKNLKTLAYSDDTLLARDFGAPYMWAVTEVRDYHSRYDKIVQCLERHYL